MDLIKWMSEHDLSAEEVGDLLGVSPKQIYNWRSAGVPRTKAEWVEKTLESYSSAAQPRTNCLTIQLDDDIFDLINRLASSRGQTIREYIVETMINTAARESTRKRISYLNKPDPKLNEE